MPLQALYGKTERLSGKISNNNITPKDCLLLVSSLSAFPTLKFTLSGATSKIINDINDNIANFDDVTSILEKAINPNCPTNLKDGGYIADGFDAELDRLRLLSKNSKSTLDSMLEKEREKTGIKNLKIGYNKVFGYYLEVTNSFKDKVPFDYIRKQTLTTGERYIIPELKEMEDTILGAEEKIVVLEYDLFNEIRRKK